MRPTAIIVGLAGAVTAAVLPITGPPLPLGEICWEGVVIPGQAAVEVWGPSFEVNSSNSSRRHKTSSNTDGTGHRSQDSQRARDPPGTSLFLFVHLAPVSDMLLYHAMPRTTATIALWLTRLSVKSLPTTDLGTSL